MLKAPIYISIIFKLKKKHNRYDSCLCIYCTYNIDLYLQLMSNVILFTRSFDLWSDSVAQQQVQRHDRLSQSLQRVHATLYTHRNSGFRSGRRRTRGSDRSRFADIVDGSGLIVES